MFFLRMCWSEHSDTFWLVAWLFLSYFDQIHFFFLRNFFFLLLGLCFCKNYFRTSIRFVFRFENLLRMGLKIMDWIHVSYDACIALCFWWWDSQFLTLMKGNLMRRRRRRRSWIWKGSAGRMIGYHLSFLLRDILEMGESLRAINILNPLWNFLLMVLI